jgi:hypothetical protein
MRCDECPLVMLDELYGLLEPKESAALAAHVATCPACAAAFARAKADQVRLQNASTLSFPALQFSPPVEPSVTVPREYASPGEKSVRATWLGWAVAAGLLLAASGTLGPSVRQVATHVALSRDLAAARAAVKAAEDEYRETKGAFDSRLAEASKPVNEAQAAYDRVVTQWVNAEAAAASARPFAVTVRGPAAALPGAPNVYAIAAVNDAEVAVAAKVVATLKGRSGKEYFKTTVETADGRGVNLRVPASAWVGVPANESLTLHVSATNVKTNQTSQLDEPIRVSAPVYSTVLTTDSPLYRPGDTIRFRSLTLDRTRFQPPDRDLNLAYALIGPDGKVVNGLTFTGTTRLSVPSDDARSARPLLGPDGRPVKGVGCGEFRLPDGIGGGAYKLAAYELPFGWATSQLPPNLTPLATRPVRVQEYATHAWSKTLTFDQRTYGPGETVTAKLRVTEQGRPVANALLMPDSSVDGRPLLGIRHPPTTDAAGEATIVLDLPKDGDLARGVLTVRVIKNQTNETIVRPIPLAPRTLAVEFFPEGGDLVAGVPNRVYVRGKLPDGKPADFDGTILDGETPVAAVRSETNPDEPGANRGVGVVTFMPKAGTSYTFRIRSPLGLANPVVVLPPVKADGVALTIPKGVVAATEPIRVTVTSTADRKLVIGAYTRGAPVAHAAADVKAGATQTVELTPDPDSPGGVTRVTVFEEPAGDGPGRRDLKPVAERLIFRTPSQRLDLAVTVRSPEAADAAPGVGPFRPGQQVTFDVTAKTERGTPAAAVLFASVTNETVYAAADDETERALPTHFLLGGEVERPDALERADVLLTNHPKAAVALDRLLGTQGWRRFAEQNPAEFRKTATPDDADRLLLAVGSSAPVPAEYKPAVRRVIETYTPRYEDALTKLERAESSRAALRSDGEAARAVASAESRYQPAATRFNALVVEYSQGVGGAEERAAGVFAVVLLAGLAIVLLLSCATVFRSWPERGIVARGSLGLLALVAVVALVGTFATPSAESVTTVPNEIGTRRTAFAAGLSAPPRVPPTAPSDPIFESPGTRTGTFSRTPNPVDGGKGILLATDHFKIDATQANATVRATTSGTDARGRDRLRAEMVARLRAVADHTRTVEAAVAAQPPMLVREYAHSQLSSDVRTNFSEVVYWHPAIVVPGEGRTNPMSFQLSDAISSYRVTVAGHTFDGRLGQATARITVGKPLAAGAKVPPEVGIGDKIDLVATVHSPTAVSGPNVYVRGTKLKVDATPQSESIPVAWDGGGAAKRVVRVTPTEPGPAEVRVIAQTNDTRFRDVVVRPVTVVPAGTPASGRVSTLLDRSATLPVTVPRDRVPGTLAVVVSATPHPLAELESTVGGLAKGPAACFEQVAASSYPNVLMLRWLESQAGESPHARRRAEAARANLPGAYRALTAFECDKPDGGKEGFDWFGGSTPHEALTAYGLTHLRDLAAVHAVDADLLARTKGYLLSLRDGRGGFRLSDRARDSFGRAPASVTNAYLVAALTEADPELDLSKETAAVAQEALASGDPYRLALAGLATKSESVLGRLAERQAAGGGVAGAAASITNSSGPDLETETTALAARAWLAGGAAYDTNARKALAYLDSRRQPGGTYGATQATVLALKARVEAAKRFGARAASGTVTVFVDDTRVGAFDLSRSPSFVIPDAEARWRAGPVSVRLESTSDTAIPAAVEWSVRTEALAKPATPAVTLTTALSATEAKEGDSVTLSVTVANPNRTDHGMVVAVVGMPAGLVVPADAKSFADWPKRSAAGESVPAYGVVKGRELTLYWRSLKAGQSAGAKVEFVAEYPGEYTGPACAAYPYYDPTGAVGTSSLAIKITPR